MSPAQSMPVATASPLRRNRLKMLYIIAIIYIFKLTAADLSSKDLQLLNELPLDKLIKLKSSLQEFVTDNYENISSTTPSYLQAFGAQAMAIKAPIRRTDYEESLYKKGGTKVSNIFTMSVTTLAFLAFGGYLLCLIVQAVKAKEGYMGATTVSPATFFVSAGIKKKPQSQFASYGRKKRESKVERSLKELNITPEQMFGALMQFCEGYAKWSERYADADGL